MMMPSTALLWVAGATGCWPETGANWGGTVGGGGMATEGEEIRQTVNGCGIEDCVGEG